jgi:hypothetical protein
MVTFQASFRAEDRMHQELSAVYFHDQAERCRRLASQVMDQLMEARLLAAAQTFDDLARTAGASHRSDVAAERFK